MGTSNASSNAVVNPAHTESDEQAKGKRSGVIASVHERAMLRKSAMLRRMSSANTMAVQASMCTKPIKGFLYAWMILLILLGLALLCMSLFLMYIQSTGGLFPTLAHEVTGYSGAALVCVSVMGFVGLHQQRRCVTENRRNYALAGFVIFSVIGSMIVILGAVVSLTLIEVTERSATRAFSERSVRLLEEAVATELDSVTKTNPSFWRGVQNRLICCGYEDIQTLYTPPSTKPGSFDDRLFPVILKLNNETGRYCIDDDAGCKAIGRDTVPCPGLKYTWCRTKVLDQARDNYFLIGVVAMILGISQLLSTILSTYTLLCDVRMIPKRSSPVVMSHVSLEKIEGKSDKSSSSVVVPDVEKDEAEPKGDTPMRDNEGGSTEALDKEVEREHPEEKHPHRSSSKESVIVDKDSIDPCNEESQRSATDNEPVDTGVENPSSTQPTNATPPSEVEPTAKESSDNPEPDGNDKPTSQ